MSVFIVDFMIFFRWLCGREFYFFLIYVWEKEKKGFEKFVSVIKSVIKFFVSKYLVFLFVEVLVIEVFIILKKFVWEE